MKIKIIVAGLGGVGGYFGGLLAKQYFEDENVEIKFLVRGNHLKEIIDKGLKVIQGENEFTARPILATEHVTELGKADYIFVATKSHDLEYLIQQLQACLKRDTIIVPLLNGINIKTRIKKILPHHLVLDACVYIVSRLKTAGVIENTGNIQRLYFGLDNYTNDRLQALEKLLKTAHIEASLSTNISKIIWEKFIFISPTATATSYFDKCIGEILSDPEMLSTLMALIEEVKNVAIAKQVFVAEDINDQILNKLKALPFHTTSSMHSDFQKNRTENELESLTGIVLMEGHKHAIHTPNYFRIYRELRKRVEGEKHLE